MRRSLYCAQSKALSKRNFANTCAFVEFIFKRTTFSTHSSHPIHSFLSINPKLSRTVEKGERLLCRLLEASLQSWSFEDLCNVLELSLLRMNFADVENEFVKCWEQILQMLRMNLAFIQNEFYRCWDWILQMFRLNFADVENEFCRCWN